MMSSTGMIDVLNKYKGKWARKLWYLFDFREMKIWVILSVDIGHEPSSPHHTHDHHLLGCKKGRQPPQSFLVSSCFPLQQNQSAPQVCPWVLTSVACPRACPRQWESYKAEPVFHPSWQTTLQSRQHTPPLGSAPGTRTWGSYLFSGSARCCQWGSFFAPEWIHKAFLKSLHFWDFPELPALSSHYLKQNVRERRPSWRVPSMTFKNLAHFQKPQWPNG